MTEKLTIRDGLKKIVESFSKPSKVNFNADSIVSKRYLGEIRDKYNSSSPLVLSCAAIVALRMYGVNAKTIELLENEGLLVIKV